jgi:hypothetical protein
MRRCVLVLGVLLAGCGGGGDESPPKPSAAQAPATPAPRSTPRDAQVREALGLPGRVPLRATGAAPFEDADVVRRWMDELRRGEIAEAAERFALPARFQNLGAVTQIRSRPQALAVTESLPCGARVTEVGGANGYVVYEAELTDRPGGACGTGVGGRVSGAILVRDGEIVEWYRLPDRPRPEPGSVV